MSNDAMTQATATETKCYCAAHAPGGSAAPRYYPGMTRFEYAAGGSWHVTHVPASHAARAEHDLAAQGAIHVRSSDSGCC